MDWKVVGLHHVSWIPNNVQRIDSFILCRHVSKCRQSMGSNKRKWNIHYLAILGSNRWLIHRTKPIYHNQSGVPTTGNPWPLAVLSGNFTLEPRPLYRNVPEGAEVPIDTLPGGDDPFIVEVGEALPESFVDDYGETRPHTGSSIEAELAWESFAIGEDYPWSKLIGEYLYYCAAINVAIFFAIYWVLYDVNLHPTYRAGSAWALAYLLVLYNLTSFTDG